MDDKKYYTILLSVFVIGLIITIAVFVIASISLKNISMIPFIGKEL
ncbi:MAG: hypothetical protein MJ220_04030 [Bacilli bacterium]|nr:hypothetical protein [Bacilli bacterium]